MSGVYRRGNKLWGRLKDESGKWSCEPTPFRPEQEAEARRGRPRRLAQEGGQDPNWRNGALYTREEVEQLISDSRIPEDRRVMYALKALAALRHSEAAGLRWSHYDQQAEPLGALNLGKTKTQAPRRVPVHREGKLLDGSFGALATVQRRAQNRWPKVVTPSGLESPEGTSENPKHDAALRHFMQCSSGVRVRWVIPPCSAKTRQKPRQSLLSWQIRGKENGHGKRPDGGATTEKDAPVLRYVQAHGHGPGTASRRNLLCAPALARRDSR